MTTDSVQPQIENLQSLSKQKNPSLEEFLQIFTSLSKNEQIKSTLTSSFIETAQKIIKQFQDKEKIKEKRERRGYDFNACFDSDGKEVSFEEVKSYDYFLKENSKSLQYNIQPNLSNSQGNEIDELMNMFQQKQDYEIEKTCTIVLQQPVQKLIFEKQKVFRDPDSQFNQKKNKVGLKVKADFPVPDDEESFEKSPSARLASSIEDILNLPTPSKSLAGELKKAASPPYFPESVSHVSESKPFVLKWPDETLIENLPFSTLYPEAQSIPLNLSSRINLPHELNLGNSHLTLTKKLGDKVYLAKFDDETGKQIAVKLSTKSEYHSISLIHSKLSDADLKRFINLLAFYYDSDHSVMITDYHKHSLLDVVNLYKPLEVVMFYCLELLKILVSLHQSGICHTDIRVENLLLRTKGIKGADVVNRGLCLVGFGRSIDVELANVLKCTGNKLTGKDVLSSLVCSEWAWNVDLVGVASVLYYLIFEEAWELKAGEFDANLLWDALQEKQFQKKEFWLPLFYHLLFGAQDFGNLGHLSEIQTFISYLEKFLESEKSLKGSLRKLEISLLNK